MGTLWKHWRFIRSFIWPLMKYLMHAKWGVKNRVSLFLCCFVSESAFEKPSLEIESLESEEMSQSNWRDKRGIRRRSTATLNSFLWRLESGLICRHDNNWLYREKKITVSHCSPRTNCCLDKIVGNLWKGTLENNERHLTPEKATSQI